MRIIAGALGGRTLKTVEGPGYRPATAKVRGAIFSLLEARGVVWSGVRVLDLFAGSGSLSFEALSRGALEACLVEREPRAADCLRDNAARLEMAERCRIVEDDVARFVRGRAWQPYEVVFIDPPYGEKRLIPTLKALSRGGWISLEGGFVLAEVEAALKAEALLDAAAEGALHLELDRLYGQTRILVWRHSHEA